MALLNSVLSWLIKKRIHQIELFKKYPHEVQEEWLRKLINSAKDTEWGLKYDFKSIKTYADFCENVPVNDYESLKPYIERLRTGGAKFVMAVRNKMVRSIVRHHK